jgi:hypothetical protein
VVSVTPRPLFNSGERNRDTHWIGRCVDLRAGLDAEASGGNFVPLPGIEPLSSSL